MTIEERENAIRCLKLWIEREPYLQTYKTCLEALEQTRWIPVSERLPDDDTYVLVTDDAGGWVTMGVDSMYTDRRGNRGWYVSQKVTAWMPLPQPYKGESEVQE